MFLLRRGRSFPGTAGASPGPLLGLSRALPGPFPGPLVVRTRACDGADVLEDSELRLSVPRLRDLEKECVLLLQRGHLQALGSRSVITET